MPRVEVRYDDVRDAARFGNISKKRLKRFQSARGRADAGNRKPRTRRVET